MKHGSSGGGRKIKGQSPDIARFGCRRGESQPIFLFFDIM